MDAYDPEFSLVNLREQDFENSIFSDTYFYHFDSNILVTVLMATKWDIKKEKDKEAISKLANVPYNQPEKKLFELASFEDTTLRLVEVFGKLFQNLIFYYE